MYLLFHSSKATGNTDTATMASTTSVKFSLTNGRFPK